MTELSRAVWRRTVLQRGVDDDLDLVAHLQRAHERGERLDAEVALHQRDDAGDAAAGDPEVERDGTALVADRQLALDGVAAVLGLHGRRAEADRLLAQHLLVDGLLDLALVLVGEGLDAVDALADLERARVGLEHDRGRRAVEAHLGGPAGDVEDEVMAHLLSHAFTIGLDLERSVLRPQRMGIGRHARDYRLNPGRAASVLSAVRVARSRNRRGTARGAGAAGSGAPR